MPVDAASSIPARDVSVVRDLLLRWDAEKPDAVFIVCEDGTEVTYGELLRRTARIALGLRRLGVARGDNVVVWMPNSVDCVLTWFAINALGAVYVPINTAYMGQSLTHVCQTASNIDPRSASNIDPGWVGRPRSP